MEITDIRVRKVYPSGRMRAVVSITFDEQFVIHDIKIVEGRNGFFIAMPSRRNRRGEFKDVAHPISVDMRHRIQESILEAYEQAVEEESRVREQEDDVTEVRLEVDYEEK